MKQVVRIGSIISTYNSVKVSDNSPLEVGDYVVAVDSSHGWGDVKPGMIGQVVKTGSNGFYKVNFGICHSEWTGALYCFIKIGKELTKDLIKQVEINQNDDFLKKLAHLKDIGQDTFVLESLLVIQTLRCRDVAKVSVTVPIRDISRLRTFKGFRNRILQMVADNVTSEVHPTRILIVRGISALGYSFTDFSTEELMKKFGGAVNE